MASPFEEEGAIREPAKTPKQRQTEEQADHEQEHEPMNGHTKPRCLKWGEGRARFRSKDKASRECCQTRGTKVRIIHYREGQYHSLQTGGFQVELRYKAEKSSVVRGRIL